jgi:hypothetical protein
MTRTHHSPILTVYQTQLEPAEAGRKKEKGTEREEKLNGKKN